ncbi:Methionine aminopeptidase [Shimia sp. SK013]|uniref:type I methionyl aminopeptidase n=1 Tax=Shimia sp. SK013 TaxID=1389006 RepID=UPI0006B5A1B7|nr:type I methionyl aminopeptidase [Shimia sp. SK013]KPA21077.1 Methionine aminopeptidase [Shimia sp. SK013]
MIGKARQTKDGIRIHDSSDFAGMHAAGALTARILDEIAEHVFPGQSTRELDRIIEEKVDAAGAKSATIGYRGYEHASCISVNHVVCHGIPGAPIPKSAGETVSKDLEKRRTNDSLQDGDILNIDVTVIVDGWFGDSSRMYIAGTPSKHAKKLIDVTHDALMKGIEAVRPGNTFGDIGHAIQSYAESHKMSVVRDFCGHGLGQVFHSKPNVLHYGKPGTESVLEEGMFFTIEPMINLGRPETFTLADDWTAVTRDKKLSAQFEHSIGVTATGFEIFTLSPTGIFHPTRR